MRRTNNGAASGVDIIASLVTASVRRPVGLLLVALVASAGCTTAQENSVASPPSGLGTRPKSAQTPTPHPSVTPSPTALSELFALRDQIIFPGGRDELDAVDPAHPGRVSRLGIGENIDLVAWSRDGSRLLVRRGGCSFFVVDADGSRTKLPITRQDNDSPCTGHASFSPDGSRIVYDQDDRWLYVIGVDGRNHVRWGVPGDQWTRLSFPSWSPDGSVIAFVRARHVSGAGFACTIDAVTPSGHGHREVLEVEGSEFADCPRDLAWSPDGSRLVFSTGDEGVMTVLSDGTHATTLVSGGYPDWSPDGSRIAFVRGQALFTMAADGTDVRRLRVDLPVHDPRFVFDAPSEFVFVWGPG